MLGLTIRNVVRRPTTAVECCSRTARRQIHSNVVLRHENPLGLPKSSNLVPPTLPRRGIPQKRNIPNVKKIVAVASGKGGVGKSTVSVNLAMALAMHQIDSAEGKRRPRVGLLDLDIFGPSIPKLMGFSEQAEPELTASGALIPLMNHGLHCMSMNFLLPQTQLPGIEQATRDDTPVVWRGLMVQKAIQQLLFDVDWRMDAGKVEEKGPGLDVLVIDMPPGTGDVPLTLGQLVNVDGAVIVTTPQDVSLADVRKGIAMFRKLSIPIMGMLLNTSYFKCSSCDTQHYLFGKPDSFRTASSQLNVPVLAELPLVPEVSDGGDRGVPYMLTSSAGSMNGSGAEWKTAVDSVAVSLWKSLGQ